LPPIRDHPFVVHPDELPDEAALWKIFREHPRAQIQKRLDVADIHIEMHPVLHRLGSPMRAERQDRSYGS
jgi:hypothetical protein